MLLCAAYFATLVLFAEPRSGEDVPFFPPEYWIVAFVFPPFATLVGGGVASAISRRGSYGFALLFSMLVVLVFRVPRPVIGTDNALSWLSIARAAFLGSLICGRLNAAKTGPR